MNADDNPVLWVVFGDDRFWKSPPGRWFQRKYKDEIQSFTGPDGRRLTAVPILWFRVDDNSRKSHCEAKSPRLLLKCKSHVRVLTDTNGDAIFQEVLKQVDSSAFASRISNILTDAVEKWWDEEIVKRTEEIKKTWGNEERSKRAAPCDRRKDAYMKIVETNYAEKIDYENGSY